MMSDAVIEAAHELLSARNYSSVVAVATHALTDDEDDTEMRLLRARALIALRRDDEAQADLRECLRRRTRCALAYRLLGELCFRRDEYDSAQVFLKEAQRLTPDDEHTRDLLDIVAGFLQSTAAVEKLPAATVAVDCPLGSSAHDEFSEPRMAKRPPRLANGTNLPSRSSRFDADLTAPTQWNAWPVPPSGFDSRFDSGVEGDSDGFTDTDAMDSITLADPPDHAAHRQLYVGVDDSVAIAQPDAPPTVPERPRSRVAFGSEHDSDHRLDEADVEHTVPEPRKRPETFGMFLLRIGALTPNQLHAAFDHQRRHRVSLAEAVIALGYATEPTIRTAGLAFRAERASRR